MGCDFGEAGLEVCVASDPRVSRSPQVCPETVGLTSRARLGAGQEESEETQDLCRKQLGQSGGWLSNGCEGREQVLCSPNPEGPALQGLHPCPPRPEATPLLLPNPRVREFPNSKNPRTSASQETFKVIPSNHIPTQESF